MAKIQKLNDLVRIHRQWILLILCLILLFLSARHSLALRSIGYDQVPEPSVILDERTWVWQGLSFRSTGIPAGWSQLSAYKKTHTNIGSSTSQQLKNFNIAVDNRLPDWQTYPSFPSPALLVLEQDFGRGMRQIPIVQPLIEQPPLGGVILSLGVSEKVKSFADLTPTDFRRATIYLALASELLIFLLGYQLFKNPLIGLLASAIYGTAPSYLLLSHYALLENVMVPLLLAFLNLLLLAKKLPQHSKKMSFLLILSGVVAGAVTLTKITGWVSILIGIILLWRWQFKFKQILLFALPCLLIGSVYFIWALRLDSKLFLDIFLYQGVARGFIGSLNFITTATQVGIVNFPLDGWWLGGFVALFLLPKKGDNDVIIVGAALTIATALMLGGANYPWYFIPAIPFCVLAVASLLWEVITQPNFKNMAVFFLFFFSSSFYWGYGVYKAALQSNLYQQPFTLYRILLLFTILTSVVLPKFFAVKPVRYLWFIFMGLALYYILYTWNDRGVFYILSHWGKLPSIYTPGTF